MNAIGVNCDVLPDGTVLPHSGYEGEVMEDAGFSGACKFDVLEARKREPAYVVARKSFRAEVPESSALEAWEPTISVITNASDIDAGYVDIYWLIDPQPDPDLWHIVYGDGHEFWVVITVNAVEIHAAAHFAGDGLHHYYNAGSGIEVIVVAKLYEDSSLGNLISQATAVTNT